MSERRRVSADQQQLLRREELLIFFSVDLENSTQLKQTLTRRNDRAWVRVALDFVDQFPQQLSATLGRLTRARGVAPLPEPVVWKLLGDEIVFHASLTAPAAAICHLEAFRQTIDEWNQACANAEAHAPTNEASPVRLPAKGAAWVAGFPVANIRVPVSAGGMDFLGPSIDAGFRIAKCATTRRIAMSVELAWIVLKAARQEKVPFESRLYYDGRMTLKGVAESTGYPHLWLETAASEFHMKEHEILGRGEVNYHARLEALCETFILEFGVPRHLPFIPQCPEFSSPPPHYEAQRAEVSQELNALYPKEGDDIATHPSDPGQQQSEAADLLKSIPGATTAPTNE